MVSVFWDELVRRVRHENRAVDPQSLVVAGGHVAVFPAPPRTRRSIGGALIVAIVVALAALLVLSGDVRAFFTAFGI